MTALAADHRRALVDLEAAMRADTGLEPVNCPLLHTFAPGVYARHIILPKGSRVVGKIHKHAHHNFIQRGHVTVFTPEGVRDLVAPCSFVSQPGTKRAVYAHEETLWITVHATNERDIDKIEEEIIAPSFESLGLPVTKEIAA